ncbi:MBL fold metallo-hydrolase [Rubrobacter aplysinae]|uniref:MBL fold metallo-hydrolase n=1 Tax=Rubrobacter aplysinae TaxID=909625 RepID=UPI00064BB9EE|nr:MBL fold metallo-hydrolase [Rubrobacter aplysinae]
MRLDDNLHVLTLPMGSDELHPSLILDESAGPVLVDTGLPGQEGEIGSSLSEAGVRTADLGRIVLTHQDLDHVGSCSALARDSGAQVLAHDEDAPYIDGSLTPIKLTPEALEQMPQMREAYEGWQPPRIHAPLRDEDRLDLAGGVLVIHTPGHTPGHVSLYLERTRTLIAGDALTSESGKLNDPNPRATPDMDTAWQSVQKLAELDVQNIVCYHGGAVTEDAEAQLRRLTR